MTERISKINRTLLQLNRSPSLAPFRPFTVSLIFPGREISDRFFSISHDITMETFHQQLRDLFGPPTTHVFVFLGPEWVRFYHSGSIVSRFLPDGVTPCPFLQDGSILRVSPYSSPCREHDFDPVVDLHDSDADTVSALDENDRSGFAHQSTSS